MFRPVLATLAVAISLCSSAARADAVQQGKDITPPPPSHPLFDEGKPLAASGVSNIEGAGGGGLSTWALVTGYGSAQGVGINAHDTFVQLRSFTLHSTGAAIGLFDRAEISFAHHWFDTRSTGAALGLGSNFTLEENVVGAKLRLFGDAFYAPDSWLPQTALGVQYKSSDRGDILRAVGARSSDGTDFYVAATKALLQYGLVLDATIRFTKANQFGILGFGGKDGAYHPEFEGAAAVFLMPELAVGGEFRTKPNNLSFGEDNAYDIFAAYFFNKNVSLTLAYASLGNIVTRRDQDGLYASLQVGY